MKRRARAVTVVVVGILLLAIPGSAAARSYALPGFDPSFYVDVGSGGLDVNTTVSWDG